MLRKFIITVICCLSISVLCAVPSYAATMSDKEMAIEQISLCWQTSTNKKNVISFDSLTSLCADLNRDGYPCEIRFVSALNGYAILGTGYVHNTFESARVYSLSGKYYSNIEGSIFYSPYQSDSLLSGISTYLSAISSKVSTISDTLSSFQSNTQNALVKIYSKLSGISDSVSTGVSHLNSINNYLSSDLTAYLQSIESSVLGANTSLGQLSTKMDSVVSTLTTENGKNSLFYPITRRLDSIISSLGSSSVNTGSLRYWRVSDDSIGSLNFSNIGYDALSSLMETATESYLDYQVVSGDTRYYLDSVDSFSIAHTTVGNTTGYFIQCVGKYRQSVNGINQFFDGVFYLTEKNSTIFYASDDSRGATGSVDLSTVESYLSRTVSHLSGLSDKLTYLFGGYEELYQFPVLGSMSGTVRGVSSSSFSVPAYDSHLYVSRDSRVSGASSGISYGGEFSGYPYTLYNVGSGFVYREVIPATYDFMDALISAGFSSDSFNAVRTIAISAYEFENVPVEATLDGDSFIIQVGIAPEWEDPFNIDSNALSGFQIGNADYRNGEIRFLSSSSFYDVGISYSFSRLSPAMNVEFSSGFYYYSICSDPFTHHDCDCGRYLVTYSSRFTNFVYGQIDRVINAINSSGGGASADLTSVTTRLDTIIEQLQTTSGESGCDHTYTQDVTQAPTCILPGLQVSTCSRCGDSYSEILAALGHDWQCTSHVEAVTDPDTGEVTQSGYDIYTCSRCGDTYNDYAGDGAPSDYGDTSLSKIIVKLFSKLGTFAGKIISWIIGLFDKMLSGLNDIITRFSDLTAQITGFGGDYPSWLSGFWGILPQEFQLALTFSFVCVFIGVIGRKLFFA